MTVISQREDRLAGPPHKIRIFFMPKISSKRLDFLFRSPTIEPIVPGLNSTVHLVRRECQECLANIRRTVPEEQFPGNRKLHRLFASSIVICSAFDLLGKLGFGDERSVTYTFCRLLRKHGRLSSVQARRIWDARNALTHSFGVRVIRKHRGRPPFVSSVRVQLTETTRAEPVVRIGPRRWQVSERACDGDHAVDRAGHRPPPRGERTFAGSQSVQIRRRALTGVPRVRIPRGERYFAAWLVSSLMWTADVLKRQAGWVGGL
jgi:hypothetical protein